MTRWISKAFWWAAWPVLAGAALASPALAAPVANPVATFSGLDKITARLTKFDVYVNETVQFGSLQITPRACYTQPPDEVPHTLSFVEIDRVDLKANSSRIFTGWMFADSPALHAVDDPLYDVWLVGCKAQTDLPKPTAINPASAPAAPPTDVTGAAKAPPINMTGAAKAPPASASATGDGAIITLLNPAPAAETPGP